MNISIKNIAKEAGVSVSTVSRALSDHPDISVETKEKVVTIAQRLGYSPNALARALVRKYTKTIGLVIPDISNPFYARLARVVEEVAGSYDYSVILCNTSERHEKEVKAIRLLREKRVDGMLITPVQVNYGHISSLMREGLPFVLVNRHFDELEIDYVINDNAAGAYQAVSHLVKLGHRQILYITGPSRISSVRERLAGYKSALEENDIPFDETLIVRCDLKDIEAVSKILKKFVKSDKKFTAVFTYSDLLAMGVLKGLRESKLKVPDDIALVGYDDIEFASFLEVPLTTVAQPKDELAKKATEILIKKINQPDRSKIERIILQPQLVVRESSGAFLSAKSYGNIR